MKTFSLPCRICGSRPQIIEGCVSLLIATNKVFVIQNDVYFLHFLTRRYLKGLVWIPTTSRLVNF